MILTGDHEVPYVRVVADTLAYGISDAQRVVIENAEHQVQLAQPERFNNALLQFFGISCKRQSERHLAGGPFVNIEKPGTMPWSRNRGNSQTRELADLLLALAAAARHGLQPTAAGAIAGRRG